MRILFNLALSGCAACCSWASQAAAAETPIGSPQLANGMEISTVYLQPIEMEPAGMMASAIATDIHLEADVRATSDNRNGFAEGDWLPNLSITYRMRKEGTGEEMSGVLMPMVASDGPHYGDNVKLAGPGRYVLDMEVSAVTGPHSFGRHVDKETGVAAWPEQTKVHFTFVYAGTGKKGGY